MSYLIIFSILFTCMCATVLVLQREKLYKSNCLFEQDVGMPADYINKLARMFQDIKVSNDLNQGFKKEYKNKGDIAGTLLALKKLHRQLRWNLLGYNR